MSHRFFPRCADLALEAESRSTTTSSATLRPLVIYDDAVAGRRALHSLNELSRELGDSPRLQPRLWRFDLLVVSALTPLATADALDSDLLLVSVSSRDPLPTAVEIWLTSCLDGMRGKTAAVVALLGPVGKVDGPDSERLRKLERTAHQVGLDFFAPAPGGGEFSSAHRPIPQQNNDQMPPTFFNLVDSRAATPGWAWSGH